MLQWILPAPAEGAALALVSWGLTFAVHSTVFLGMAWLLDRRSSLFDAPDARWLFWCLALVAPFLTASVRVGVGGAAAHPWTAGESEKLVARVPVPTGALDGRVRRVVGSESGQPGAAPRGSTVRARRPGDGPGALGHEWPYLLALIWGVVAGVGVVRLGRRWRLLVDRLRRRRPEGEGRLRWALERVAPESGLAGEVGLSVSGRLTGPVALPGGEICVPERAVDELPSDELEAMLAHELAHLRRRDPTVRLGLALLEALFFFQPLVKVARRGMVEAAEARADAWVRGRGRGVALAGTLVTVARWIRGRNARAPVSRLASSPEIEKRVHRLLEEHPHAGVGEGKKGTGRRARWAVAVALGTLMAAAGPGLGVTAADHHPADPKTAARSASGGGVRVPTMDDVARGADLAGGDTTLLRRRLQRLLRSGEPAAYVRLAGIVGPVDLTLRPTHGPLRVAVPGHRTLTAGDRPEESGSDGVTVLRVDDVGSGDVVLWTPPGLERVAVDVGGRLLAGPGAAPGSDLPRLVDSLD